MFVIPPRPRSDVSTTKEEAIRLVSALPDDATWHEIVDVVARRAVGRRADRVRELLAPYATDGTETAEDDRAPRSE